jgi:hypothetical protein
MLYVNPASGLAGSGAGPGLRPMSRLHAIRRGVLRPASDRQHNMTKPEIRNTALKLRFGVVLDGTSISATATTAASEPAPTVPVSLHHLAVRARSARRASG